MRAEDIVEALQEKLPLLVDDFSNPFSISAAGVQTPFDGTTTTLQVTTATPHNLSNDASVFITNIYSPVVVTAFDRVGIAGTIVTATPHDLTKGSQPTLAVIGANESAFNGVFEILNVPNRNTVIVKMADSGAITATGALRSLDIGGVMNNITGLQAASSINSPTTFLYEVPLEVTEVINNAGQVKTEPRISASISLDRFIDDSYTKQLTEKGWVCVVLGDSTANKSRRQDIDSTDNIQRTQYFNQKFAQTVEVFVVFPTTHTITGRSVRDRCEELLQPLCQCILFKKFDSLMTAGKFNPLQFTGAGFEQYNTAYYAHRYSFEITIQMQFEDTIGYEDDVAFRDINLVQELSTGVGSVTAEINLDESAG